MWIIIGIFFATLGIIAMDVPYLLRQGLTKELWAFSILLAAGVALSVLQFVTHTILPNPLDAIITVYKPVSRLVFGLLS